MLPLTAASHAQDGFPISTDRPSFSDGTGIVPHGRVQIESGYTWTRVGGREVQSIGELLLRIPLTSRVEFRFSNVNWLRGGGSDGWADPSLGVKVRLQDGVTGKRPDLVLVVQSTVPAGSRGIRVARSQPTLKIAGYQQLDAANGWGWNVVYSHLGASVATFDQWAFSAFWAKSFSSRAGGFAEVYHVTPVSAGGSQATFADLGITYLVNPATQLDLRVGSGFHQRRDGWFAGAGISYRF